MWTCPNCKAVRKYRGGHPKDCTDQYRDIAPFWSRVQVGSESECWPFMGARVPAGGYGRAHLNGKLVAAHRIAYMTAYGNIASGLDVMHLCDNPPCCNPKHLRAVTTAENMADCKAKGRNAKGEQLRAKLTEAKVIEIRQRFVQPSKKVTNARELADEYGCGVGAIFALVQRRSWKHVP